MSDTWRNNRGRAILQVLRAVSIHRDREHLFTAIAEVLRPLFPFDELAIILDGPGKDEMTPFYITPRVGVPSLKRSHSAISSVFNEGKPLYVRSREDVAKYPGSLEALRRFDANSYVALPLVVQNKTIAALLLQAKRVQAYDDLDIAFATEVAAAIAVALDSCLTHEAIARSRSSIVVDNMLLREQLRQTRPGEIVASSPVMQEVIRQVELVAPTDATVLITGETGSGKERLARLIHDRSARADRPMIALNCAAIPMTLIESELFGHEAGAFTGANRMRRGRFELANRGTLMLDEIGELELDAQAKLLRVLQTQELERVGGTETVRVDVRVIAATNRDLTEMVEDGRFRSDLYYRLAVFPIELPPLWARRDDIPALAQQFLDESARRIGILPGHLDKTTIDALRSYTWPGNVRELQNVIERAVILARGGLLDVAPLLDVPREPEVRIAPIATVSPEVVELQTLLESVNWVIEGTSGAAARLGVSPSTLRSRMRRLKIERPR